MRERALSFRLFSLTRSSFSVSSCFLCLFRAQRYHKSSRLLSVHHRTRCARSTSFQSVFTAIIVKRPRVFYRALISSPLSIQFVFNLIILTICTEFVCRFVIRYFSGSGIRDRILRLCSCFDSTLSRHHIDPRACVPASVCVF